LPYAKTIAGEVVHFPGTFVTDAAGVIIPPRETELEGIAARVHPGWLLRFSYGLVRASAKHRHSPRHEKLNHARLALAQKCIARAMESGPVEA
jgi:hypothetical protein